MKLFRQNTDIQKFENARAFAEAFQIGEGDFIFASKSIYDVYFKELNLPVQVAFKSKYGAGEPNDIMMDQLLKDFQKTDCRRIIAIGGGAVIDMAKLLVLKEEGSAQELLQRQVPVKKVRELIAVPTTCGAGSEVSNISILELTGLQTKLGLADDEIYPDYAVLIPQFLECLPYEFFVTSAIDALIHAIESYVSPRASIYTETLGMKAAEMILHGFQQIVKDGPDARFELLEEFLTASNLAGISFGNAGTGAVHAMSYPLSGVYHVTHGEANYQFFTAVFAEYQRCRPEGKIMELNRRLSEILKCSPDKVYSEIETLLSQMVPRKALCTYGMKEEEIRSFAESVEAGQQRLLNQSYVKFTVEQMTDIYRRLYES